MEDKLRSVRIFQETFFFAEIRVEVVLGMLFLIFSNADIHFPKKHLTYRSYTIAEAQPTTKRVELIDKKEFAKATLHENLKTFVVYVAALKALKMTIHPSRISQILGSNRVQITALKQNYVSIKVLTEYSDFADVFSEKKSLMLPEQIELNWYAIEQEDSKQLAHRSIYSLNPIKLETLKTYIKTHLKTGFIRPLKSPIGAPILFDKKLDSNFCLCIDY